MINQTVSHQIGMKDLLIVCPEFFEKGEPEPIE
jgi:hypothetical protein